MTPALDRRRFTSLLAGLGLAGTRFPALLWSGLQQPGAIPSEAVARAAELAGLSFTDEERALMLRGLEELRASYAALREVRLPNHVPPALVFDPAPGGAPQGPSRFAFDERDDPGSGDSVPDDDELAFLPLARLSRLVRTRRVSATRLAELALERLRRHDERLECVVTLTAERALEQAARLDRELDEGLWRGPLHGLPYGAKDLLAARGAPTTWGAQPFREQVLDADAEVVRRLEAAGAVLVAKLSLGALAWGDVWFGGTTRNPWNPEQGSSGSSAGSAAAVAAGLVPFAIGSETWGSIVSPCARCGATGLRPTFGRVSRAGAMALSWSMDKLGPIARGAADCAAVFHAIHGADGVDPSARDAPFAWPPARPLGDIRVGFVPALFERPDAGEGGEDDGAREVRAHDRRALEVLRSLGFDLRPVELPDLPVDALSFILSAEAAAAFDELTRSGRDDELVRQVEQAWPNVLRQARTIPAVEYLQANRVRTLLARELARATAEVDVWATPAFAGDHLLATNLTGHPAVVLPHGFRADGTPTAFTLQARLYADDLLLSVAHAFQQATGHHLRRPPGF